MNAYEIAMATSLERQEDFEKQAFFGFNSLSNAAKAPSNFMQTINSGLGVAKGAAGVILSALVLKTIYTKISNDLSRKRIIEDLSLNDPVLKSVPKKTLMEWYATMYAYAPTLTTDKQTVKEVLTNFARFGKIDLNTLKMLADTEKSLAAVNDNGVVKGLVSLMH